MISIRLIYIFILFFWTLNKHYKKRKCLICEVILVILYYSCGNYFDWVLLLGVALLHRQEQIHMKSHEICVFHNIYIFNISAHFCPVSRP